jgi:hypothetical protein
MEYLTIIVKWRIAIVDCPNVSCLKKSIIMSRILILIFIIFSFSGCNEASEKIIGIKIYDYSGDFNRLVSVWEEMGINTAFVSTTLAADKNFREILSKKGISVFIIFPVFFNPEMLRTDSTLYAITNTGSKASEDWVKFVCPSRKVYRDGIKEQLSEFVSTLDPDGVSIDFIRQFVYWEKIYPDRDFSTIERSCYCDSCIEGFSVKHNIIIPESCPTTVARAEWVEKNHQHSWDAYRCDLITSMVKELSEEAHRQKSDILVNVHIVPWKRDDFNNGGMKIAGQDLDSIEPFTDYISPMCYSQMLDREAEWISDVVKDMDLKAKGMVIPSIQVYPYYIERQFTAADFSSCMVEALKPPSRGVIFFSWPLFEKDSSRIRVVSEVNEQF